MKPSGKVVGGKHVGGTVGEQGTGRSSDVVSSQMREVEPHISETRGGQCWSGRRFSSQS